jgi:hypothetical protein
MGYRSYKDVNVTYGSTEILCKSLSINNSNSLGFGKDRLSTSTGVYYANQRPTTVINLEYLIGSDGDLFYQEFSGLFDGSQNFTNQTDTALIIGDYTFTGLCPQSLSISASDNSLFNASASLTYYGNINDQIEEAEEVVSVDFEDDMSVGHSAASPVVGVDGVSALSFSVSLKQNPIFLITNDGTSPDFIDITERRSECSLTSNDISNFVTTHGDNASASFTVKDLDGNELQDYSIEGKIQSTEFSLSAEDVVSTNISIISFR